MKPHTPLTLLLSAITATAVARPPVAGDFDGDGRGDAAFFDAASATLEVGYEIAAPAPDWHTVDLRRHHYFDGRFLRAADLNGDGRTDLYAADRAANRVLVLWADADRAMGFVPEEFTPGAGPAFADLLPGTERLAVPLLASAAPSWHHFQPENPAQNPSDTTLDPSLANDSWSDFRAGRQTLDAVINAATFAAARSTSSGEAIVFQTRPFNALSQATAPLPTALDRLTAFGFFEGAGAPPATVAFGVGADEIVVLQVTAGLAANPPSIDATTHNVGPIAGARTISTPDGDRLLLVAADGGSASVHEIDGAALNLEQIFDPPAGGAFLTLAQGADGDLIAALIGGQGFAVYSDSGAGYELQANSTVPQPPAPGYGTQLVLYDKHPYGARPALPIEGLPAGDWGSAPSLAGITISATLETLLDPLAGLGNPSPLKLDAAVGVPGGATVFANQFQADTCIAFDGGPASDGSAAVLVTPPGGSYASTVELQFLAAPGTTVHFRPGGGAWRSTASSETVTVDQSVQFEYYGSNGTALSAIRTEDYIITQDPGADTDGDKVPDAIEKALGLSPFAGSDSDGDGHSDFSEILQGTDPKDPSDHPVEELKLDTISLEVTIEAVRSDGALAPPIVGTEVRVLSLDGGLIETAITDSVAAPQVVFELESAPPLVVVETVEVFPIASLFFQLWPHGRRVAAVVEIPPLPTPTGPVDLASEDIVGDWLAGVNAAVASFQKKKSLKVDGISTLHALAVEAWLAARLETLGLIGAEELPPQIIDDPVPGVRHLISADDLAAVTNDDGALLRHGLTNLVQLTRLSLKEPANAPLLTTALAIYATSAGSDPANSPPPPPIPALRQLFEEGAVPPEYSGDLADTPVVLGILWDNVVNSPLPDTVVNTNGLLETAGADCLVLVEPGLPGTRYELVDAAGLPYWQTENAPILDGASAALVGFVLPDATPACGDVVIEVVSLQVTAIPPEQIVDTDGDGLPDDLEAILLGLVEGGFWDDPDGDGYATGEELFLDPDNPSDPADGGAFPNGPPAIPANTEVNEPGAGDHFTLEWDGNPAATYVVECAIGLDGTWIPSPVPPVENPAGHYTWEDPNTFDEEEQKFYRIVVQLSP